MIAALKDKFCQKTWIQYIKCILWEVCFFLKKTRIFTANAWLINDFATELLCNKNLYIFESQYILKNWTKTRNKLFQQKNIRKRKIDILPPRWENADIRNGPLIRHWNQRNHHAEGQNQPAGFLLRAWLFITIKGVAEKTQRIFRSAGVRSYLCPAQKIKQILSRP